MKRRLLGGFLALTICLSSAWWAFSARMAPPGIQDNAILSDTEAFIVLPPEIVTMGRVDGVYPSPDGSFVLILRHTEPLIRSLIPPPAQKAEASIVVWNMRTRHATTVLRSTVTPEQSEIPEAISWIPDSGNALVLMRTIRADSRPEADDMVGKLYLINGASGSSRAITAVAPLEQLIVGERSQTALLYSGEGRTIRTIRSNGALDRPIPIPGNTKLSGRPDWWEDGVSLGNSRAEVRNGKRALIWDKLDVATGTLTETTERRPPARQPVSGPDLPPLRVGEGTGAVQGGDRVVSLHPLWLVGTNPALTGQALVTPDGQGPTLLPGGVLFVANNTLYVSPIIRTNLAEYRAARQKALREVTMSNAKQVGLAMLMYCQDYDERFPLTDGNIRDSILPYLKSAQAFNDPSTGALGITFAYQNTELSKISSPATEILGYLTGPGGRAVIYVDGHVTWQDNP